MQAFPRQRRHLVPFSLVTYEQEEEKGSSKNSTRWHVNMASHRRIAMCSAVHPRSMKSVELAQEIPADLIVMPTHGYTGLKHVFLGSTAETRCSAFALSGFRHARKKLVNRRTGRGLRLTRSWSRWISPIARGKVSSMPSDSRMNLGPRSFCSMPLISDTSIQAKALHSMTFPACKRLLAKMPSAKCESSCGR